MTAGRTRIKICGLSRVEDIGYVNEALPDYCGFVIGVPSSRRNVTVEQLVSLKERLSDRICPVGVFVNAEQELVAELLNVGVIDIAQLHGREDEIYIRRLRDLTDKPLIKAFSVQNLSDLETAEKSSADLVLLDHGKGGTGASFEWELLRHWKNIGSSGCGKEYYDMKKGRYGIHGGQYIPETLMNAVNELEDAALDCITIIKMMSSSTKS